ncbi:MAG TPA: hypothetical protein VKY66_05815 [Protaetiibacter sp.]|nr:hypothetical protein [Protaetiibacter sp.]
MDDRAATDYEFIPDDERIVPLDEEEPSPPPTLDPDERIEHEDEDDVPLDDERPV